MEKLEKNLKTTPVVKEETIDSDRGYETGYRGLELIDEKVNAGGTSIKYWM
jgi:hypothetical protein